MDIVLSARKEIIYVNYKRLSVSVKLHNVHAVLSVDSRLGVKKFLDKVRFDVGDDCHC